MASSARHCRDCGFRLASGIEARCPECGRPFDPDDPTTTSAGPKGHALWAGLRTILLLGSGVLGVLGTAAFGWLFIGGDILLVFVLGLPFAVFVAPVVAILAGIPRVPVSPRLRGLTFASAVFFLLVVAPLAVGVDWPMRMSFAIHQRGLDAFADRLEKMPTPTRALAGERVGMFSFRRVILRDGNLGLQVSGNDGGGQFLVRRGPDSTFVWINTNWEVDLGNGWWFVYQD